MRKGFCFVQIFFSLLVIGACRENSPILSAFSNGVKSIEVGSEFKSANDCADCHKKIHGKWSESRHGTSYTNSIFKASLEEEPRIWCLNCHAPQHTLDQKLADIPKDYNIGAIAKEGVNCAVCHVREGKIYGARELLSLKEHPVYKDKALVEKEMCIDCHDFNFPRTHHPITSYNDNPMQSTGREFLSTYYRFTGSNCQSCHLPKSHRLGGAGDREFLIESIKFSLMTVRNGSSYQTTFRIKIPKIGHAFPTGDLFRAISLRTFNANGGELAEKFIRRKVRVIDAFIQEDTRLYPNFWEKGVEKEIILVSNENPARCEINYQYQHPIENKLKTKLEQNELVFQLYKGSCETN